MKTYYRDFLIRDWQLEDRQPAADVIRSVLEQYNLPWQPDEADRDVCEVEKHYIATGGEFWVAQKSEKIVGTAAYYPIARAEKAVEIRKMYLLPAVRGQGLGKYLLLKLEETIASKGFHLIWIETASILKEAVKLYESNGYQPTTGIETQRCDRVYLKHLNGN